MYTLVSGVTPANQRNAKGVGIDLTYLQCYTKPLGRLEALNRLKAVLE
jgi:hypothetical protein